MSTEDLNEGDFESWDFSMHKDSSQIQLNLETNVYVGSVDRWRPPKRKASIRDLIKTRSLRMSQLFILH